MIKMNYPKSTRIATLGRGLTLEGAATVDGPKTKVTGNGKHGYTR